MNAPDALAAAAAGMRAQADTLDVIAQNLANASTPGFRARQAAFADFGDALRSRVGVSAAQGSLRHTGVPTDVALNGPGYLSVATPDGVRYTRDGRFSVDPGGFLVDSDGNRVLGSLGPVRFPHGARIGDDGTIAVAGKKLDRLRVVAFDAPIGMDALAVGPSGLVAAPRGCTPRRSEATVHAGFIEDSGVEPVAEMAALVATQRAYEANQKSAARTDESLRRLVTELPTVRA